MTKLVRTTSDNPDFQRLTRLFDDYLVVIDGDEKDFFAQYNQIYLEHVIVCYEGETALGCGAFKPLEGHTAEIKRMFVLPEHREKGIATSVLHELENWAKQSGFTTCILETSNQLKNAIALYQKSGYETIPNYGQYVGVESSICMQKSLN
ncbi:GNAT family N-acetyltransferase [Flavobacterium silvisoli]|uniref:GNAT family N-acetyltransferase n=1 Tax=Flavobacterium silvisoli TaxID=2529433 RepID=A0A4Q9Z3L7_9FLAO|nr:GNAT family N-acetyltransferase [Flavobacterium silvisoli]TBX71018.1 GNAT family N-acetyltransferase [Flavobacterium silvisoli]